MKYIRTKDNIFEVENTKPYFCIFCKPKHTKMLVAINDKDYEMQNIIIRKEIVKKHWKDDIIAQADTIEELCDMFILKGNDYKEHYLAFKNYDDVKDTVLGDRELYGAIWCEWGLKYVAKMNLNGDLELL